MVRASKRGIGIMVRDTAGAAFGQQLRRERERRGLGVDAVCEATKVPIRHILSLEAGAFEDLPGGVFRRGFLRSYLEALGLDESAWMARFEETYRGSTSEPSDSAWTTFAENVKNSRSKPRRRRSRSAWVWSWVAVVLLIGAVAAGVFFAIHRRHPVHLWKRPIPHLGSILRSSPLLTIGR